MDKVLVIKQKNLIIISQDGKRFMINKENELFDKIKDLSQEEIKEWYLNR